MRYQLIRDKKIFELSDSDIEICDNKDEINNFSVKEIMNLLNELKEVEYSDISIYVDIYSILLNLIEQNGINETVLTNLAKEKAIQKGNYSKYLLKIK